MTDMQEPAGRPQPFLHGTPPPAPAPQPAPEPEQSPVSGRRHRQLSPEEAAIMEAKIRRTEVAISLVLRIGVIVSVLVITVGLVLMFAHHSAYVPIMGNFSYRNLTSPTTPFPHSFAALSHSIAAGEGQGIIVLGVLILVLTPVIRVAVGVLAFLYEKDVPMALVTFVVLVVLVGSFFLAQG